MLALIDIHGRNQTQLTPCMNAYAERFAQTIKEECLDDFVVFGTLHLGHLCREFLDHCYMERPHQGPDNELLIIPSPRKTKGSRTDIALPKLGEIRCRHGWAGS